MPGAAHYRIHSDTIQKASIMSTLTARIGSHNAQPRGGETPPPLRLPRFLLEQLAQPITSDDDAGALAAKIRMADARGLL